MTPRESRLASACSRVGETAKQILGWLDESDDLVPAERETLLHDVYHAATKADRLAEAMDEGPCVAFVGPRRSGKTQLISSVIDRAGTVAIRFEGIREHVNLAKQISPDGAKLGSTAVLRLSARSRPTAHNFPVAVRLLTVADVVKVMGATFFTNVATGKEQPPSMTRLSELGQAARAELLPEAVPGLSEADVWDIRHYFATRFGEEPIVRALLTTGYWESLADLTSNLPNSGRAQLLSALWGGLAPLTRLFVSLADSIGSLGYGRDASCALDAILGLDSRTGRLQRRTDNVIAAQSIQGLGQPDTQTVMVSNQYAQWKSIARTNLSAIIAEVRLPVAGSASDLLEQADVLEFPAIEGQNGIGNLVDALARDPSHLGTIYLRAKSVYLLERYIEDQTITSMVVCIDAGNPQAGELAELVAAWVEKSHGADAATRELQANGLFVCFTKLDKEFAEPQRRGKDRRVDWGQRIVATLHDGFGRHASWPTEWTTGRAFDNVHLLRNPNTKAKHLCNYGNDGREMGFKAGQQERIERARRDFLGCKDVRRHLSDPIAIWNEAFQLNDGGTSYLAQSIGDVCTVHVKRRHMATDLTALADGLHGRMRRYHVAADADFQKDRRHVDALVVTRQLRRCAEQRRFGHLIRALQMTDTEFSDALQRFDAGRGAQVGVDAPAPPPPGRGAAEIARTYSEAALAHWIGAVRLLAQSSQFSQSLGLPRSGLVQLVDEVINGAVRLDLDQRMARQIESVLSNETTDADRVAQAAVCAASTIGEYIMWLGFNDIFANRHPRRKGRSQTPIFPPKSTTDIWSVEAEPHELDHEFLTDWSQAFLALVDGNAARLQEQPADPARNARLGEMLEQLNFRI